MKLSAEAYIALIALHEAPNHTGDIVNLFMKKGVSEPLERAWSAGKELMRSGLLDYYTPSRSYAVAKLNKVGRRLAAGKP
jgi:hypothetical protein